MSYFETYLLFLQPPDLEREKSLGQAPRQIRAIVLDFRLLFNIIPYS